MLFFRLNGILLFKIKEYRSSIIRTKAAIEQRKSKKKKLSNLTSPYL